MGMRIMKIMLFMFLVNLVLPIIYGFHIFSWGAGAATSVASFDWRWYAGIMIGTGLITGIFGMLTQTTAQQLLFIFTSATGTGLTVATMRWLGLGWGIEVIVDGMMGILALYAIIQVLTGSVPD